MHHPSCHLRLHSLRVQLVACPRPLTLRKAPPCVREYSISEKYLCASEMSYPGLCSETGVGFCNFGLSKHNPDDLDMTAYIIDNSCKRIAFVQETGPNWIMHTSLPHPLIIDQLVRQMVHGVSAIPIKSRCGSASVDSYNKGACVPSGLQQWGHNDRVFSVHV